MANAALLEPQKSTVTSSGASRTITDILVHVQNDATVGRRVEASLSIARATGAHLSFVHVTPIEAYVTMKTLGGVFALGRAMDRIDAEEASLRSTIEAKLREADVSWHYEQVTGYVVPEIVSRSALADLVVIGREAHGARIPRAEVGTLGEVLAHVRTPLFIPGSNEAADLLGTAIIAWNGSFEAANTVRGAAGLLSLSSAVRVVRYAEDKTGTFSDQRLIDYLSRHGIDPELDVRPSRLDFADDLIDYAARYHGSYIVMGGYSHSRASELVFGGVTRALLHDCPLPVVISH